MRLTDQYILSKSLNYNPDTRTDHELMIMQLSYAEGLQEARGFYENQKCDSCAKTTFKCNIKAHNMPLQFNEKTFGCTEWEQRA